MSSPEDSWPLPLEDEMAATDARLREITPSQINYASPEVEQAYVRARTLLTDRLLGQVTELQDQVSVYGESATLGLDQIAPLEGLLPEEDIQALRADFQSRLERAVSFFNENPPYTQSAQYFMEKVAAAGLAVSEAAKPNSDQNDPVNPESEEPIEVNLTITDEGLQIVDGEVVPFSNRAHAGQRDYTLPRKKGLAFFVERQGEELLVREIWKACFGEEPFHGATFKSVVGWLHDREYQGIPLVDSNHVKGNRARYFTPKGLLLTLEDLSTPDGDGVATGETNGRKPARRRSGEFPKGFSIEPDDLFRTGWQLKRMDDFMRDHELPPISDELLESLEIYKKPKVNGQILSSDQIVAQRHQALYRVSAFLEDDDEFRRFVGQIDPKSPEYALVVDYFGQFLENWNILPKLISATIEYDREDGHPKQKLFDLNGQEIRLPVYNR